MREIAGCRSCRNWEVDGGKVRARCLALEIFTSEDFFCSIYRQVDRCPLCGTPGIEETGKPYYKRCAKAGCMVDRFCVRDIEPMAIVVEPGMQNW